MIFSSLVYLGEQEFGTYEKYIPNSNVTYKSNNTWTYIGNLICIIYFYKIILFFSYL